jgi:hypothetical protein
MNMTEQYVKPPSVIAPQLSRSDLARLTPEQIVQADESRQFEVIKTGRDPIDAERRGERWATPTEIAEALQAAAADRNRIKTEQRAQARAEGVDVR